MRTQIISMDAMTQEHDECMNIEVAAASANDFIDAINRSKHFTIDGSRYELVAYHPQGNRVAFIVESDTGILITGFVLYIAD